MRASLALIALVWAPSASARPALNHVYVVLDQSTFDAIRSDPRVTQLLGPSDGGLPDYAPPPADTDRIFLRGRTTYLELFAPKNRFNEPVGKVGIALAEDRARDFERLAKQWQAHCPSGFSRATVAWTQSQPPIPWYDSIQCRDTAVSHDLSIWATVYRPEFGRWQSGAPRTDRRSILAPRAAAGQGMFDITGLTLSIPVADRWKIAQQLSAAGFRSEVKGRKAVFKGRGWSIVLQSPHESTSGVTTIQMRTRNASLSKLRLGRGDLTFEVN